MPSIYPKISIGIPVYNQEKFIESTILSVINQDYPNLEIIVSNDNSKDNTDIVITNLLQKYNFKYFKNDVNIGMVANYRKLLYEYATGDWYLNLDGDDLLADRSVLSNVMKQIASYDNDNVVLFSGDVLPIKFDKVNLDKKEWIKEGSFYSGLDYFNKISIKRNFSHAGCLYKRSVALSLDFYSWQALNTDFHSIIKLCFRGNILVSKNIVSYWREHGNNQTYLVKAEKNSSLMLAYLSIYDFAKDAISYKEGFDWYTQSLIRAEITRIVEIKENNGFLMGLRSHFIANERLSKNISLTTLFKYFYLAIN